LPAQQAFVAYVRGQSDAVRFKTVSQPGFEYLSGYVEFSLRFIRQKVPDGSATAKAIDYNSLGDAQRQEKAVSRHSDELIGCSMQCL
jgi:hypothetical protein